MLLTRGKVKSEVPAAGHGAEEECQRWGYGVVIETLA